MMEYTNKYWKMLMPHIKKSLQKLEVLPVMCEIDHLTAKLMHITLHREQTLAGGGQICDYWFVGDRVKNPQ